MEFRGFLFWKMQKQLSFLTHRFLFRNCTNDLSDLCTDEGLLGIIHKDLAWMGRSFILRLFKTSFCFFFGFNFKWVDDWISLVGLILSCRGILEPVVKIDILHLHYPHAHLLLLLRKPTNRSSHRTNPHPFHLLLCCPPLLPPLRPRKYPFWSPLFINRTLLYFQRTGPKETNFCKTLQWQY